MVMSSGIIVALAIYCARFPRWAVLKRNSGRFIFVSSEAAAEVHPDIIHYGVTKTGQVVVARGLAEMAKGSRVRCCGIGCKHCSVARFAWRYVATWDRAQQLLCAFPYAHGSRLRESDSAETRERGCYFALRTGPRGMEILLQALPRTRRDMATA